MTGVFPSVLKTAKVVPVFKKDCKLDYSNYHPISLLSNIEKYLTNLCIRDRIPFLLTKILNMTYSLDSDNILRHALINIIENIRKALDDENMCCGVFVDL